MTSLLIWCDLERDVIVIEGPDAASFLHSQLAQDINTMTTESSRHSLLLEPTGHVSALLRVVRHSDELFTLDVDSGFGADVVTRLQRFVLRAKVTLRVSDWKVRAFRGDDALSAVGTGIGRATPAWGSPHEIDIVAPEEQLPNMGENTELGHIDALRVDARWPRLGVDVLVGDIPATCGVLPVVVSFTKGCYPGQELVERMDSRGTSAPVVVRSLVRDGLGVGARLSENDANVGTVTSAGVTLVLARIARGSSVGEPLI
jgi:hypothetical protein